MPTVFLAADGSAEAVAQALVQAYNQSLPGDGGLELVPGSSNGAGGDPSPEWNGWIGASSGPQTDWTVSLGWSAVAVVVNTANPVRNLASADVRDILIGIDRNWAEVGGADLPINVFAPDPASDFGGILRGMFPEGHVSGSATITAAAWATVDGVASDPGGIGFVPCADVTAKVKPLSVGGVPAAGAHAADGTYPFRFPLLLSARQPVPAAISDFAAWAQSETGRAVAANTCVEK